jgi:hypothetical protein
MDPLNEATEKPEILAQKIASLMAGCAILHSLTMFETSLVSALLEKEIERLGNIPGMEIMQRNLKGVKKKFTANTVTALEEVLKLEHARKENK